MIVVTFSEQQREAILHRLGVGDAIGDALSEEWPPATIEATADALRKRLNASPTLSDELTEIERAVLADTIEGSTWVGCADMEDGATDASVRGAYRALVNAAEKLRQLGVEIEAIPGA